MTIKNGHVAHSTHLAAFSPMGDGPVGLDPAETAEFVAKAHTADGAIIIVFIEGEAVIVGSWLANDRPDDTTGANTKKIHELAEEFAETARQLYCGELFA